MFERVLVANRGEIAVRILATLRRLGVRSVLAASVPDARSLAARLADDVIVLPGTRATDTYLDAARIIEAASRTGCEAIHPGYGFLSERADFAEACAREGITFVGPPGDVLRRLGDKVTARALAARAGVPVVPGWDGDGDDIAMVEQAVEIGFPVMLKARGGGGGRGMRLVHDEHVLREAIASARREAEAAFGDGRLFLEKYVVNARHVEVQVLADGQGGLIHLGERDCSVQRRHQKLIEESPSPVVDAALRRELTGAALRLMREVGYVNAGTVEFLVGEPEGGRRPFYFIEVNPRLQVEHPVTEMRTGLDMVELQLRVAAGEPLPLAQDDVSFDGHAIELRINAEDPWQGFQPAPGRIASLDFGDAPGVRGDAGYAAGDEVPGYYDSLLGKLIVHAADRDQALEVAARQLVRPGFVEGVATNARLHLAVIRHASFRAGEVSVTWLEEHLDELLEASRPGPAVLTAVAAVAAEAGPGFASARWVGAGGAAIWLDGGGDPTQVTVRPGLPWQGEVLVGSCALTYRARPGPLETLVQVGDPPDMVAVAPAGRGRYVARAGEVTHIVTVVAPPPLPRGRRTEGGASQQVTAPLAGTVAAVEVAVGQPVEPGVLLLVLEAMKLEHRVTAPVGGVVRAVHVTPGAVVAAGALLVELG
ncbi:MAG: acetyl-CoA carboxylase biotin carboxylase subunit [Dehalococcoidia bacterium]